MHATSESHLELSCTIRKAIQHQQGLRKCVKIFYLFSRSYTKIDLTKIVKL
jgi:hypothetical protein